MPPVEMHESCPTCGSRDFSFVENDEAACDSCGERFYPDVSGERYQGPALSKLYHVSESNPDAFRLAGIDSERNTHGWVYLTSDPKPWLDYFSGSGQIPTLYLLELNVDGLELFHDPAGYAADFYVEGTIPPARIIRSYRYDQPAS